jgi:hypothetical protein
MAADPLLGGPAPGPVKQAAAGPVPNPQTAQAPLPPPPAPSGSASTAALAATSAPLDATHDLRIANPAPPPGSDPRRPADAPTWQGQTASNTAPPAPPAPAVAPGPAPSIVSVASAQVTTYEQAQAALAARGVSWQRLETWGDRGDWKFSCSIPNPQNRYISRTYEAQAHDYLSAIRAVLDQINKDH